MYTLVNKEAILPCQSVSLKKSRGQGVKKSNQLMRHMGCPFDYFDWFYLEPHCVLKILLRIYLFCIHVGTNYRVS